MYLNPNFFLFFNETALILWDYENHQQFELETEYIDRLLFWCKNQGNVSELSDIDQEMIEANLLTTHKPESSEWGWDVLSRILHIGTSNISTDTLSPEEWIEMYTGHCQIIAETPPQIGQSTIESIALPEPSPHLLKSTNLLDVLFQRKTCRSFYGKPMTLSDLSTLLYYSFGMIHKDWPDLEGLKKIGMRKAFPSGGGLHAEEVYVVVNRVDGIEPGIFHYNSQQHHLSLIKKGFFEPQIIDLLGSQFFAEGLSIGIFISSRFDCYWWKYAHSRGYRPALLDIGHASQTFLLTATALKLQTWLTAVFNDSGVKELLEISSKSQFPLLFVGAGYGSNDSIPPKIREYLVNKNS